MKPGRNTPPKPGGWEAHQRGRTSTQRGYGASWQKLRAIVLNDEPSCVLCLVNGLTVPSTTVDHIVPKAAGGTDARSNLRGVCKSCHAKKTGRDRLASKTGPPSRLASGSQPNRSGGSFSTNQNPHETPSRPGPDPLAAAVKTLRGTLRPHRERARAGAETATSAVVVGPDLEPQGPRNYVAEANGYLRDVAAGRIVACKWVRKACARQDADLKQATTGGFGFVWSDEHANDACAFIEQLPHVEGKWTTPTITLQPWQAFVVCLLFGWRHRSDMTRRRFTSLYLEVARKAAKSTLMAGIALYHMLREGETGASVITGAKTGNQARIVFGIMTRMIRKASWLRDEGLQVFSNAITLEETGGSARPINSKASTQDGLNPSCIVLDESHAQDFALHDV